MPAEWSGGAGNERSESDCTRNFEANRRFHPVIIQPEPETRNHVENADRRDMLRRHRHADCWRRIRRQMSDGLYFLANDRVLNWSIAFLESVRSHEPELRLVMIPFDSRIDEIARLADQYRFEIFDHRSLSELDEIGKTFYPTWEIWQRTFRKFAVFWGPLERFIFSDVDIVHLEGVQQYADAFERSGLDLLYSDDDM